MLLATMFATTYFRGALLAFHISGGNPIPYHLLSNGYTNIFPPTFRDYLLLQVRLFFLEGEAHSCSQQIQHQIRISV